MQDTKLHLSQKKTFHMTILGSLHYLIYFMKILVIAIVILIPPFSVYAQKLDEKYHSIVLSESATVN